MHLEFVIILYTNENLIVILSCPAMKKKNPSSSALIRDTCIKSHFVFNATDYNTALLNIQEFYTYVTITNLSNHSSTALPSPA